MTDILASLSSKSGPVPLLGVKVEGDILGRGAKVKVFQRFRNKETKAIEAVYKFPLPEGAAICGFKASIDGRVVQGIVEEREKAFEMYDDALSRGDGGYLLDEERPNIFTLSVGNLNPDSEVLTEIEYVTLLDTDDSNTRFFLPTTISPRYIPDGMKDDNGISEDSKLHGPYATDVPYGLSISLNVHRGDLLNSVESPSHQINIENMKGERIRVGFTAESVKMDRDFILNMKFEDSFLNRAYLFGGMDESFVQLDLCLDAEEGGDQSASDGQSTDLKEVIFLIDCSGSMGGDSIGEAKKALEVCLRGLDQGTLFNIYRFGSTYKYFNKKSVVYSKKTLDKALGYVKAMDADLGGTEILEPFKHIYSSTQDKSVQERDIILMTDGQVSNEEEVLSLAKKYQASTRVFPIGIGAGPNEYFIKGLARATRGAAEFIFPGERIEPKVLQIFSKLSARVLVDPVIDWGGTSFDQAPISPAIFIGASSTIFAKIEHKEKQGEKITLKGSVDGHEKVWKIGVLEYKKEDIPIPILWAREMIRDLEESHEPLFQRGSRQRERKEEQLNDSLVGLSKKFGLLSQKTSFVAIEERDEMDKTTSELILRKIPIPVTVGWHGIGSVSGAFTGQVIARQVLGMEKPPGFITGARRRAMKVRSANCLGQDLTYSDITGSFTGDASSDLKTKFFKEDVVEEYSTEYTPSDLNTKILTAILRLQKAEGGMELNKWISYFLDIDYKHLRKISSDIELEMKIDKFLLLSTAILLQTLEIHFAINRPTWKGVIKKSRDWLDEIIIKGDPRIRGKDLMPWVSKFVQKNVSI